MKKGDVRGSGGQFRPGTKPGPGRPPGAATRRDYGDALRRACTPEDIEQIARLAVTAAKRGDPKARTWLADTLRISDAGLDDFENRLAALEAKNGTN